MTGAGATGIGWGGGAGHACETGRGNQLMPHGFVFCFGRMQFLAFGGIAVAKANHAAPA